MHGGWCKFFTLPLDICFNSYPIRRPVKNCGHGVMATSRPRRMGRATSEPGEDDCNLGESDFGMTRSTGVLNPEMKNLNARRLTGLTVLPVQLSGSGELRT